MDSEDCPLLSQANLAWAGIEFASRVGHSRDRRIIERQIGQTRRSLSSRRFPQTGLAYEVGGTLSR